MMEDLPKADVVVVNPSHFAVALRYDDGRMGAPRVIAKGVELLALQIRGVAGRHRIPIVESPPLARADASTELVGQWMSGLWMDGLQVSHLHAEESAA